MKTLVNNIVTVYLKVARRVDLKNSHHKKKKCNYKRRWTVTKLIVVVTISDTFELWCWRRLLIVPCTARRSNQSILKEINPEYSLEALKLKLKLKLQYFGHLM